MTDPSKRGALKKAKAATSAAADALKAVPEAAVTAVVETLREEGVDVQEGMTYLEARTANEVLKAQERKLRVEKLKGELVDVAQVRARVFRFAREQRDAWLNWPNRVAAVMAAELGIDAVPFHAALDAEVRRHLGALADIVLKL
ncbi:MAG: elements of external origin [Rhodospirillales bacterium]|nr:elements of external origin [Rhodospirillales bacterium]